MSIGIEKSPDNKFVSDVFRLDINKIGSDVGNIGSVGGFNLSDVGNIGSVGGSNVSDIANIGHVRAANEQVKAAIEPEIVSFQGIFRVTKSLI